MSGGALHVRHDALRRGGRTVLAAGELTVPGAAAVALVGANGAGKSTLLMAVARALAPRCGRADATLDGRPVATVGWVPQRPAFPAWLPLGDVLALHGVDDAAADLLAPPGARAALLARPAGTLSAGQAQALAAAIALLRDDPLVLLDEPFAGVDVARRLALHDLVAARRARQPDVVLVLSSHVPADLDALCDWVVALRDGRCVHQGPRGPARGERFAREVAALTG